ncbi:MAG: tetratricopeptide repeat protein [candidate division Zixibacteria bacterium]|nr:tetratricopeptide repeat protein [candidate division Zixibacteria bacterium]
MVGRNKMKRKRIEFYILLAGLIIMVACSGSPKEDTLKPVGAPVTIDTVTVYVPIPPGIDTTTAIEAYKLADKSFVSLSEDSLADALYDEGHQLKIEVDSIWSEYEKALNEKDSVDNDTTGMGMTMRALELHDQYDRYYPSQEASPEAIANIPEARFRRLVTNYERARDIMEQVILINPYNDLYRGFLATLYSRLAQLHRSRDDLEKSIELYENLIRLNKGYFRNYYNVAQVYEDAGDYRKAYENYRKAEEILLETWHFETTDTNAFRVKACRLDDFPLIEYATYIFSQALMQERMWRVENAIVDYRRLREVSRMAGDREYEQYAIDGIAELQWDYGDIAARQKWLEFWDVRQNDEDRAALLLRDLLPRLDDPDVRIMAQFEMGVLEWTSLNQREQAITRIGILVDEIELDENGAVVDTSYYRIINSYGSMCFTLGKEYEDTDKVKSLQYYLESTKYEWDHRGSGLINCMIKLQNRPEEVVRLGQMAVDYTGQLNEQELKLLFQLMIDSYKKIGDFRSARMYYSRWRDLQNMSGG